MTGVAIIGVGAVTPVGLSAPATCAALRAGIARMGPIESFLVPDQVDDPVPVTGGRVPLEWLNGGPIHEDWPGHDRFKAPQPAAAHLLVEDGAQRVASMAATAVAEAWASLDLPGRVPADYGLFLGLDEREDAEAIAAAVRAALGWESPIPCDVSAAGRASFLAATQRACAAITAGALAGAIVVGADSWLRRERLEILARQEMLKDDDHPLGIIPGEGAGALILCSTSPRALGWIQGCSITDEATAGTERPNQAVGLSRALRAARAASPPLDHRPIVVCDLNGDRYRALEWALADTRSLGDLRWGGDGQAGETLWHPADSMGDIGAASGAVNVVVATQAIQDRHFGECALVWGASEGTLRGAIIICAREC